MPARHSLRFLTMACAWLTCAVAARGQGDSPALPAEVAVTEMKTSIYVGSVTLNASPFVRSGDTWTSTYTARVFPWAFWNEHGEILINIPEADVARLLRGETVEFSGEGKNHKGKPRTVTGRAQPDGAHDGRIKVRIGVDDVELVFNGDYTIPAPAGPVS